MPNDVDQSLLERLQALRGVPSTAPTGLAKPPRPHESKVALIERRKPATGEDALAARLKSLRDQHIAPSRQSPPISPGTESHNAIHPSSSSSASSNPPLPEKAISERDLRRDGLEGAQTDVGEEEEEEEKGGGEDVDLDLDLDAMLQTDISVLEEMLAHVGVEGGDPSAERVNSLLNEIASTTAPAGSDNYAGECLDRCGGEQQIAREADDLIARFRDEIDLEATSLSQNESHSRSSEQAGNDAHRDDTCATPPDLDIPSLPQTLDQLPVQPLSRPAATDHVTANATTTTTMDDITARLALLRAPSANITPSSTDLHLPSVPSSLPTSSSTSNASTTSTTTTARQRLTSTTSYADDDIDGWCIVCLEDATLLCPACGDDDAYCTRCWREMHVGPAAAFDDRSHKAVYFTKERKKAREQQHGMALGV